MRSYILSLTARYQPIFIIGLTVLLSFLSALLCSMFFNTSQLVTSTELISSIYQVMGTVYAILLTFTLWGVWENFTAADKAVQNETYALLDLVHILETSSVVEKSHIREIALGYLKDVVEQEWPTLKTITSAVINKDEHSRVSSLKVVREVQNLMPNSNRDAIVFGQALTLLSTWLDARRTRILSARGNSARAMWPLLFTGALVLFAFHGLFVTNAFSIWFTLLFGTSLVIGVTFYLIFTLDCPYEGSLSVDSEPFRLAINVLNEPLYAPQVQLAKTDDVQA